MKTMYTYIMSHVENKLFHIGVTNNIKQRVFDHKNATFETHVGKFNIKQLVWFEKHDNPIEAVKRKNLLKNGNESIRLI